MVDRQQLPKGWIIRSGSIYSPAGPYQVHHPENARSIYSLNALGRMIPRMVDRQQFPTPWEGRSSGWWTVSSSPKGGSSVLGRSTALQVLTRCITPRMPGRSSGWWLGRSAAPGRPAALNALEWSNVRAQTWIFHIGNIFFMDAPQRLPPL